MFGMGYALTISVPYLPQRLRGSRIMFPCLHELMCTYPTSSTKVPTIHLSLALLIYNGR